MQKMIMCFIAATLAAGCLLVIAIRKCETTFAIRLISIRVVLGVRMVLRMKKRSGRFVKPRLS